MAGADAGAAGLRRRPARHRTTSTARVDGADFVLVQIRVGGQAARLSDETIPLACGCIGQETTGAGGLAKALRTVPVVLEIAERVRERARRDAWIVDFTNPVGIVTRALLDAGHRAIGLCNVAIGFQRRFAALLGVAPSDVVVDQVGLNHLTWIRARARRRAPTCSRQLLADHGDALAERGGAAAAAARRARSDPVLLPALLLRARRRARRAARRDAARGRRGRDRARICSSSTATRRSTRSPRCSSSAAARSTARRRPGWSRRSSSGSSERARGRHPQRRHARGARRRRRRRGARARSAPACPCPCPRRRSRRSCSGSRSTSRRTSGSRSGAALSGDPADRAEGAARASADRPVRRSTELVERLLAAMRAAAPLRSRGSDR